MVVKKTGHKRAWTGFPGKKVVGYPCRRKGPENTGNGRKKDMGTAAVFKPVAVWGKALALLKGRN
jgi:hypothetical protein